MILTDGTIVEEESIVIDRLNTVVGIFGGMRRYPNTITCYGWIPIVLLPRNGTRIR